jgi:hypothetical protein
MDGEGHFAKPAMGSGRSARMNAVQKDDWPLRRLQEILGGNIWRYQNRQNDQWYWRWELYGNAAMKMMLQLQPLLSPRRQERIQAILENWEERKRRERLPRGIGLINGSKTHCKRGHEFTPENTYIKQGKWRQCRACQRELVSNWHKRKLFSVSQIE